MRLSRRFSPSIEPMAARIAPSTIAPVGHGGALSPHHVVVATLDGAPTTPPSGDGSYPIIMDPPTGTTTGTVC